MEVGEKRIKYPTNGNKHVGKGKTVPDVRKRSAENGF